MSTNIKAILGLVGLGIALAVVVFVPAGTLGYWQGWTWLAVFILGSLLLTLYLMVNDPALLRRRMRAGPFAESSPTQRIIMLFVSAGFLALVAVPALDHRFGWSVVPTSVCILGDVLTALMFLLVLPVMSANPFSAGTVQVESGQRVISSGPYAVVRHPMYAAASLTLPGVPLALGSWWGLLAAAVMIPFLLWRLIDEEHFLAKNLPGYAEYQQRVRWRLIPGVF